MEDDTTPEKEEIFVHDIYGMYQYVCHPRDWISRGAYGSVYRATITEPKDISPDATFAVKVVPKTPEQIKNRALLCSRWRKMLELDHRHLISYYKVTIHKAPGGVSVEFLMDYVNRGEHLAQYMAKAKEDKRKRMLDHTEALCYALQIADGLAYLHKRGMINGDLKPENVLVKHTSNSHKTMLISDLDDIVQKFGPLTTVRDVPGLVGTYRYMSPEMMKKFIGETTVEKIGSKTDLWSLGCIILKMANSAFGVSGEWLHKEHSTQQIKTEKQDFDHHEYARLVINGWLPFIPNAIPDFLASCIRRCFIVDSVDRISAADLVCDLRETVSSLVRGSQNFSDECYCANKLATPALQLRYPAERDMAALGQKETFGSSCKYYFAKENYLARGAFGIVYQAKITDPGDYYGKPVVAVKSVQFTQEEVDRDAEWWKTMQDNWKRLLTFKHEHLVRFHKGMIYVGSVERGIQTVLSQDSKHSFATECKLQMGCDFYMTISLFTVILHHRISLLNPQNTSTII